MPKRFALRAAVLVLVFCLITPGAPRTWAQTAAPAPAEPTLRVVGVDTAPSDADFAPLRKRVDEAEFENAPFDQCISWLQTVVDANIVVRYQTLEDAGVERDKPITLSARGLTAAQTLWMILSEAGGPDIQLGYESYGGDILIISTRDDLDSELEVRIYDVAPLLNASDERWKRAELRREQHEADMRETRGPDSPNASQSIFSAGSQAKPDDSKQSLSKRSADHRSQSAAELLNVLQNTIRPDTWMANGGRSTAELFDDLLVVRAPRSVHRELEAFLQTLTVMAGG